MCNEGARNLTLDRPSLQKLLIQIRRATGADQLKVLQWLGKEDAPLDDKSPFWFAPSAATAGRPGSLR